MSYFKAVLKGNLAGAAQTRNVFYFDGTTEGDQYIPADIELYIDTLWAPVQQLISLIWECYEIEVFKWVPTHWEHFAVIPYTAASGVAVDDAFPNQMAAVILGITSALKTRGRKAIAGFVDTSAVAGLLTGGALIQLALAMSIYVSHLHGSTGDLVPGTWTRATNTFHPFIGGVADAILGTMRRRKPGIGI